jgi:hypothetical protein
MTQFEWDDLRYVLAVASAGSFEGAEITFRAVLILATTAIRAPSPACPGSRTLNCS